MYPYALGETQPCQSSCHVLTQTLCPCSYQCVFAGISVPANASTDGLTLTCISPSVSGPADRLDFTVLDMSGAELQFAGPINTYDREHKWTYFAGWDTIDFAVSPSSGTALGGTLLTLRVYGFAVGAKYRAVFWAGNSSMVSVDAVAQSDTLLRVRTPAWGELFGAGNVTLRIETRSGVVLPFTGNGSVALDGPCTMAACRFLFVPLMYDGSLTPSAFPAARDATTITVKGLGFDAVGNYTCVFSAASVVPYSANAPGRVRDSQTLACSIPARWLAPPASDVQIDVTSTLYGAVNKTSTRTSTGASYLKVLPLYVDIAPQRGLASGHETVTVTGLGFDTNKKYMCEFDGVVHIPVSPQNYDRIVCLTPEWYDVSKSTKVTVKQYDNSDLENPQTLKLGRYLSGETFEYLPSGSQKDFFFETVWVYVEKSYSDRLGGTNGGLSPSVDIHGFGFQTDANTVSYTCEFLQGDRTELSTPVAATSTVLVTCPPIVWDSEAMWGEFQEQVATLKLVERDLTTQIPHHVEQMSPVVQVRTFHKLHVSSVLMLSL
jgi:hypothetical protein